jgi:pimeloyl-ACP methyl ester carboxylesterase
MNALRRIVAPIAGLAAAAVLLSGCLFSVRDGGSAAPSRTPDVSGVAEDLLPYYAQTIDWSACGTGFECAMVTAPLDWADPATGDIDLAVVRHAAQNGAPLGSLLVNPGGPGASGVSIVRDSLGFAVGPELADAYDVVGFDPRGVGESTSVHCYDAPEMDAYLFDIPTGTRGSDEWNAQVDAANAAFAQACDANSGGILPYITTENAARDMDLLRGVLGDPKLNYLGYSYGTFLGTTYAGLFPDRVGRMVLDGAMDPAVSGTMVGVTQGIGFESALRAYMASCLEDRGCPFRGTVDDAMADLGTLFASLDRTPLRASDGREVGGNALMLAIASALYSQGSWPALTQALTQLMEGDPTTALSLVDSYYGRFGGVYQDNSQEAFTAYNCMDYPRATPEEDAAGLALLEAQAPTIAPYWYGPDPCLPWPYAPTGTRGAIAADGAPPILVIGTTNDPATPYEWAVSLADELSSGILITRVGEGHTGFNKGNTCVDDAVVRYFVDDDVPAADVQCG